MTRRQPRGRLVPASFVRSYFAVSGAQLRKLRKAGAAPDPLPGTRLYDFEAVKRALDRWNNPVPKSEQDEQELIERARRWGESR